MTDANDELSGSLTLRAQSIVSAVSDLAAQISDDPDIAGLAEALGTNDGSLDQGGYVRAVSRCSPGRISMCRIPARRTRRAALPWAIRA